MKSKPKTPAGGTVTATVTNWCNADLVELQTAESGLLGYLRKGSQRGFAAVCRRTPVPRGRIEAHDGSPSRITRPASPEAVNFTTNRARQSNALHQTTPALPTHCPQ